MTYADDYHASLTMIQARGNANEIIAAARAFMHRADCSKWHLEAIKYVSRDRFDVTILHWDLGQGEDKRILLSYDSPKNAWFWNNGRIADAHLAEHLGVPVSYLGGFADALLGMHTFSEQAIRNFEKANALRRKATVERQRARERERALVEQSIRSREVRRARISSGKQAAKYIAEYRQRAISAEQIARLCRQSINDNIYPAVPVATIPAPDPRAHPGWFHQVVSPLPHTAGIYFVWAGPVVYVGQSICLAKRAHLGHENIKPGDYLSWVELPVAELNYAESYYIGILKPTRNFGGRFRNNKAARR